VTGYQKSKSLISAGRRNKYKILHKIVRETQRRDPIHWLLQISGISPIMETMLRRSRGDGNKIMSWNYRGDGKIFAAFPRKWSCTCIWLLWCIGINKWLHCTLLSYAKLWGVGACL